MLGSAELGLCKCQSADLTESLEREGFLVPTIVLLSGPRGKQVGAQVRKDNATAEGREWSFPPLSRRWRKVGRIDKNSYSTLQLPRHREEIQRHEKADRGSDAFVYLSRVSCLKSVCW